VPDRVSTPGGEHRGRAGPRWAAAPWTRAPRVGTGPASAGKGEGGERREEGGGAYRAGEQGRRRAVRLAGVGERGERARGERETLWARGGVTGGAHGQGGWRRRFSIRPR
jgi:hypothetical protein